MGNEVAAGVANEVDNDVAREEVTEVGNEVTRERVNTATTQTALHPDDPATLAQKTRMGIERQADAPLAGSLLKHL
ncbi:MULTISPECIES: hypothetical protein [Paraburkholderia]|uniref:hypothetical protein n=1 Tax=Paraburkholderia TaxID=1822464 RepID=UPI0038B780B4